VADANRVFQHRDVELQALDEHWGSGRAEFLIVTGRRRVGKSRLLEHFFDGKLAIYAVGTSQKGRNQLADASREIHRVSGDPVLEHQDFESWDALLAYIGEYGRQRRVALVLDEFAYYCDEHPELPSLLQRWWDRTAQHTRVMLVLASSHIAFMEDLFSGDRPLYGRRTGEFRLQPLDYAAAGAFLPSYSPVDRLRAYAVFGGMPAYLAACTLKSSLAENIRQVVLRPSAYLRTEPTYLLAQERSIDQPRAYFSLLRAISEGKTQPNDIALAAGFRGPSDISRFLQRLRELRLVERLSPLDSDRRARASRYLVADHFLAFWFRFVQPSEALLDRGRDDLVLERVQAQLDLFVSRAQGPWEQACRDYLWRAAVARQLGGCTFDRLGAWWVGRGASDSSEIDLVGREARRTTLLASCKWRNEYMKPGDLDDLRALGKQVGAAEDTLCVLFSRSGFDRRLVERAKIEDVRLITPAEMFDPRLLEARPAVSRIRRAPAHGSSSA
jgi:uncharacterized protein